MVNFLSADLLQNGSFEQVTGVTPTNWIASGNLVVENSNTYSNRPATSGTKMVAFNTGQLPGNAVLSQTFPTTPGQSYAVNFDLGIYAFNTNTQSLRTNITGNTPLITPVVETLTGNGNAVAVWTPKSYAFVADSTSTTVTFTDISANTDSVDMLLDNVRVGPPNYRTLAVTSSPTSAAAMTIAPSDALANGDGPTGLIRSYNDGTAVTVTAPRPMQARISSGGKRTASICQAPPRPSTSRWTQTTRSTRFMASTPPPSPWPTPTPRRSTPSSWFLPSACSPMTPHQMPAH